MVKTLKFIHITKTAGTAIENSFKEEGIDVGRFHSGEYGYHHEFFFNKPHALKKKYDWFMVVRNPYERILSEYHCNWGKGIGNLSLVDENDMTDWLKDRIDKGEVKVRDHVLEHNKEEMADFLINQINQRGNYGDHYGEQWKYWDRRYNIKVIKFENLQEEFGELMLKYGLDVKLKPAVNKGLKRRFKVSDFPPRLIKFINEVYDKDFKYFGYEKIEA